MIADATSKTRRQLLPFSEAWAARRALYDRSAKVLDVSELLSNVEKEREKALLAVSTMRLVVVLCCCCCAVYVNCYVALAMC